MTDTTSKPRFEYDRDSKIARIWIGSKEIVLDLAGVDDVIWVLGEIRSLMDPLVKSGVPDNTPLTVVRGSIWQTRKTPLSSDVIVHIRDPRFGWLNYALLPEGAQQVGESLSKLGSKGSQELLFTKQ